LRSAETRDDIENSVSQLIAETRDKMLVIEKRETEGVIQRSPGIRNSSSVRRMVD